MRITRIFSKLKTCGISIFLIAILEIFPNSVQASSSTASVEKPQLSIKEKRETACRAFGDGFKPLAFRSGCYDWERFAQSGLAYNDPTDTNDEVADLQFVAKSEIEIKWIKRTQIGTLSSFIRLQSQFDPAVSEDLILGRVDDDFAVGLDGLQLHLNNKHGQFTVGKIENAGSVFISDGYTRRGAESLDARSALGFSYQTRVRGFDVVASVSEPSKTTSGSKARLPNFGLGIQKRFGAVRASIGGALIGVDGLISRAPLPVAVSGGRPLRFQENAQIGYGLAAQLGYVHPWFEGYAGVTYAHRSSNDVLFAFSDGFDAISLFGGLSTRLGHNLRLNFDLSYITATQSGLRNQNGFDSAVNIVWSGWKGTEILAEFGYDTVDSFGAGDRFFFEQANDGEFGGFFLVKRKF